MRLPISGRRLLLAAIENDAQARTDPRLTEGVSAPVGGQGPSVRTGWTASLPEGGTSGASVGALPRPHRHLNSWGHPRNLTATARRWYPLLLLRDARGRFARLRRPVTSPTPARRPRRPRVRIEAVQLALF